jgi:hypothetical protein
MPSLLAVSNRLLPEACCRIAPLRRLSLTADQLQEWGWRIPFLLDVLIAPVDYICAQLRSPLGVKLLRYCAFAAALLTFNHWHLGSRALVCVTMDRHLASLGYMPTYAPVIRTQDAFWQTRLRLVR